MTLVEKQRFFCRLVSELIQQAITLGYEPRFGDAYRDPRAPYGHQRSLHRLRLAVDLLLDRDGVWLRESDDYEPLGAWWEAQHPLCAWGGRFAPPDGNHFSVMHDGMR